MTIKVKEFRAESAGKAATPRVGLLRLERLAGILEDAHKRYKRIGAILDTDYDEFDAATSAPAEIEGYDQNLVGHACGTPACAIGHYAVNTPRRWSWTKHGDINVALDFDGDWTDQVAHEFCLAQDDDETSFGESEVNEIFGDRGCDNAKTALEAAKYIRKFVAKKRKALGLKKPAKK